jgi:SAM-dependent methyltransferase
MAAERVDIQTAADFWAAEHLARYHFAKSFCIDKIVLDIACGTGFGSAYLLNNGAKFVYAADVSDEALAKTQEALKPFPAENYQLIKGDGLVVPLGNASVDVITSMETIEHIENDKQFLREVHRVLKPDGVLLISTPNGMITNPSKGTPSNPFHLREYFPDTLIEMLRIHFKEIQSLGQGLSQSYGPAPFLPGGVAAYTNFYGVLRILLWKMLLRFPASMRDRIFKRFSDIPFCPNAEDYAFLKEHMYSGHVQLHICRPK